LTLRLIAAPAEPAVSLADLLGHLNLENLSAAQAADLSGKLDTAAEFVASELRRCLITSTYDLYLESWPCRGYLDLPLGNLQSVTHIKYTDSAGTLNTMDAAYYKTVRTYAVADDSPVVLGDGTLDAGIGRVCLAYGQYWPTATLDTGEPIVIRFTCGWADAASVPKPIKQAIMLVAAWYYRQRDAATVGNTASVVSAEIALGVQRLIAPYEIRTF
jgi:hypothetical protein